MLPLGLSRAQELNQKQVLAGCQAKDQTTAAAPSLDGVAPNLVLDLHKRARLRGVTVVKTLE